jgi:hypothetical protein
MMTPVKADLTGGAFTTGGHPLGVGFGRLREHGGDIGVDVKS